MEENLNETPIMQEVPETDAQTNFVGAPHDMPNVTSVAQPNSVKINMAHLHNLTDGLQTWHNNLEDTEMDLLHEEVEVKDEDISESSSQINLQVIEVSSAFNRKFTCRNLDFQSKTHKSKIMFQCEICNKEYCDPRYLKQHLTIHSDTKQFQCDMCNKSFKQSGFLIRHLRTHIDGKAFTCKICNKIFTCASQLKQHLRSHTDEKPFECKICYTKFRYSGNLKAHFKIHTGEKPFECKSCHKTFSQNSHLKNHMKTHASVNLFG